MQGVLERFEQFGEKLWGIVGVGSVRYNGKVLPQVAKLAAVVAGLQRGREAPLPVVLVDYLGEENLESPVNWIGWEELGREGDALRSASGAALEFYQADFNYPLWVLFSSGTTGKVRGPLFASPSMGSC